MSVIATILRRGTHIGQLGGQSGHSSFVGSRSFPSSCVPTLLAPVIVCVNCRCRKPCMQSPVGEIVGSVVAGCDCVCDVGSAGRGIQKGTAVRAVEAGCSLGGGIV